MSEPFNTLRKKMSLSAQKAAVAYSRWGKKVAVTMLQQLLLDAQNL